MPKKNACPRAGQIFSDALYSYPGDAHKAPLDAVLAGVRTAAIDHRTTIEDILAGVIGKDPSRSLLPFLALLREDEHAPMCPPGLAVVALRQNGKRDDSLSTVGEFLSAWRSDLRPFIAAIAATPDDEVMSWPFWGPLQRVAEARFRPPPPPPPPPAAAPIVDRDDEDDEGTDTGGGAPAAPHPAPAPHDDHEEEDEDRDDYTGPKFP